VRGAPDGEMEPDGFNRTLLYLFSILSCVRHVATRSRRNRPRRTKQHLRATLPSSEEVERPSVKLPWSSHDRLTTLPAGRIRRGVAIERSGWAVRLSDRVYKQPPLANSRGGVCIQELHLCVPERASRSGEGSDPSFSVIHGIRTGTDGG
jgi:hypothetical protein